MRRPAIHSFVARMRLILAVAALVAAGALASPREAQAGLPQAGSWDALVSGQVSITSLLGSETIALTGTATIAHSAPYMEGGVQVIDLQITDLLLTGESVTGEITVVERTTIASVGEVRSLQASPAFPASSFFDVYVQITVPAEPGGSMVLRNDHALHIVPRVGTTEVPIDYFPPRKYTYGAEPPTPPGTHCAQPGRSGLPLVPSLPAEVCVTSFSAQLQNAVGGVAELPGPFDRTGGGPIWYGAVAVAAAVALAGAAAAGARRLRQ